MHRCSLPHVRAAFYRWARPSTVLILGLAVAYLSPGIYERHFLDRPWIRSDLAVTRVPGVGTAVRDEVTARLPLSGERLVWIEGESGARLCRAAREDGWEGEELRIWEARAFFNNACDVPQDRPWRACTRFVVDTERGSHASFGTFCSAYFDPRQ